MNSSSKPLIAFGQPAYSAGTTHADEIDATAWLDGLEERLRSFALPAQ